MTPRRDVFLDFREMSSGRVSMANSTVSDVKGIGDGKLNPRAKKGVFTDYPEGVKGFKVWLLEDQKVVISRNVVFREDKVFKEIGTDSNSKEDQDYQSRAISVDFPEPESGRDTAQGGEIPIAEQDNNNNTHGAEDNNAEPEVFELNNYQLARDRPRRETKLPARLEDYECDERDGEDFFAGIATWILIERPKGHKAIGCKWIFKRKPGIIGVEAPRYKARLVAKGYAQKEGVDYQEIFAPAVKHVSIRYMLSAVVHYDMELEQLDVKTALLHGNLDEFIVMEQPEGFVDKRLMHLHFA
ncbi:unnamed protein product [Microthlaspi erraticum]|uniref:Uncharacterized protein n=1 Tax=Microthlaspi erraticum TaxID=1685480 RepID=A0A6D2HK49_9BRAS|nr:unnamed protein product [Microthlaspi erraticum]